jgi:hypothetical protein
MAAKAEAEGNEVDAERYWREMAVAIPPDDPDDRKWHLLAVKRADDLAARIHDRRAFVEEQIQRVRMAFQAGRPKEAFQIQAMLREKYGRFTDVADLFAPVEPEPEPDVAPKAADDRPE